MIFYGMGGNVQAPGDLLPAEPFCAAHLVNHLLLRRQLADGPCQLLFPFPEPQPFVCRCFRRDRLRPQFPAQFFIQGDLTEMGMDVMVDDGKNVGFGPGNGRKALTFFPEPDEDLLDDLFCQVCRARHFQGRGIKAFMVMVEKRTERPVVSRCELPEQVVCWSECFHPSVQAGEGTP